MDQRSGISEMRAAFQLFDSDSKGFISVDDLRKVAEELSETVDDEQLLFWPWIDLKVREVCVGKGDGGGRGDPFSLKRMEAAKTKALNKKGSHKGFECGFPDFNGVGGANCRRVVNFLCVLEADVTETSKQRITREK
uniref:EF-hand domain-containing protein n=1 Tax=Parascaris equorum TaxID=6256 RepID=A0A914R5P8_PAREQ